MIVQVGIFIVCLALAALFGTKAAREVFDIAIMRKPAETEKNADTEEQKRKAERSKREIENFMAYDGREQEGWQGE